MDNIDYCVEQALIGCNLDRKAIHEYLASDPPKRARGEIVLSAKNGNLKWRWRLKQQPSLPRTKRMPDLVKRWRKWRPWYKKIVAKNPHWDIDLVLYTGDMPHEDDSAPVMSICSFGVGSQNIPVPTWDDRAAVKRAKQSKVHWDKKRKQVNFIGAPRNSSLYHGRPHPRIEFCNWAKGKPGVMAFITNGGKGHTNWEVAKKGLRVKPRGPMSTKNQLKFRYLLNIDGNSTAWYRLPWQMASNSVCMNLRTDINSQVGEWYYPLLGKEGIPLPFIWVTQDDILDIKRDLDRDDERCQEQIRNSNAFVKTYLSQKSKISYTTKLFEKINSLMK